MNREILKLYFVAGSQDCRHLKGDAAEHLLEILQQALQAGIRCFQFRDKGEYSLESDPIAQKALAQACQQLCQRYHVPFIMNDMVELAYELGADGIHVGQGDQSIIDIRKHCPKEIILGLSINTLAQAKLWNDVIAVDYFGVGPIFPTQSKNNHNPPVGLDFIQMLRQNQIDKPIVAIGSVKPQHVATLRQNGADGVAVISAITQATNISASVTQLLQGVTA